MDATTPQRLSKLRVEERERSTYLARKVVRRCAASAICSDSCGNASTDKICTRTRNASRAQWKAANHALLLASSGSLCEGSVSGASCVFSSHRFVEDWKTPGPADTSTSCVVYWPECVSGRVCHAMSSLRKIRCTPDNDAADLGHQPRCSHQTLGRDTRGQSPVWHLGLNAADREHGFAATLMSRHQARARPPPDPGSRACRRRSKRCRRRDQRLEILSTRVKRACTAVRDVVREEAVAAPCAALAAVDGEKSALCSDRAMRSARSTKKSR